ncbi:WD repeat and HMG-box DNA-binding protein 1-like [Amblyomma americanum]
MRPQRAIQPGAATPRPQQRYVMVWNMVGRVVHCPAMRNFPPTAVVKAHEASAWPTSYVVLQPAHYMWAALSLHAVVLFGGAPGLLCRPLLKDAAEWTAPVGNVRGVALGSDWLVAVCKRCCVRLFSLSGLQRAVWCTPGAHVAVVAFGDQLGLFYHAATEGAGERQAMSVQRFLVRDGLVASAPLALPLRPRAMLLWAGFSDQGRLCWADNLGRVHLLLPGDIWTPICQLEPPENCHYFLVGVRETTLDIWVALCSGQSEPEPWTEVCVKPFRHGFLPRPFGEIEEAHALAMLKTEALQRKRCREQGPCLMRAYREASAQRDTLLLHRFEVALEHRHSRLAAELACMMRTTRLAHAAAAVALKQALPALAAWIRRQPTRSPEERPLCGCVPDVLIRPLSMAELRRRQLERRLRSGLATPAEMESAFRSAASNDGGGQREGDDRPPCHLVKGSSLTVRRRSRQLKITAMLVRKK